MPVLFLQLRRTVLLAVLTLALVATGYAHRLPGPGDQAAAAMLLAGASAADICGDLGSPGRHADPLCQACQIAGGAAVPEHGGAVHPAALVLVAAVSAPRESRQTARVLDDARPAQGPPFA